MVDQVELVELVALAMAKVIAERHGHQNAEDWLSDERREEARAALEASHHAELVEALKQTLIITPQRYTRAIRAALDKLPHPNNTGEV